MHAVVKFFLHFQFLWFCRIYFRFCGLQNYLLTFCYLDFPLERKTPIVYEDGVYEIVAESRRGNVLVISNLTQHGLSGLGSARRTAFFTFFGMQNYITNQIYYRNSRNFVKFYTKISNTKFLRTKLMRITVVIVCFKTGPCFAQC